MKRIVSMILASILLFTITVSFASDYSSMTDAELRKQLNNIRNELTVRGLVAEKKTVILDQASVQIYINGSPELSKTWNEKVYLIIPVVIINDSGKSISVIVEDTSVNGWKADGSISGGEVPKGKKAKAELKFLLDDTDVEGLEDFEDFELWFKVYDNDDWFGTKVIDKSETITVYASQVN